MNTENTGKSFSLAYAVAALEAYGIKGANMYHTAWDCCTSKDEWNKEGTVRKNSCQYTHHFEIPNGEYKGSYIVQVVILKETDISKTVRTRSYSYSGFYSMKGPAQVMLQSNAPVLGALKALPYKLTVSNKTD